jgi:metal-responsive CopG/Arc/MetJ family transcriptional regulator
MERTETKIDRELVERARELARSEGRGESELIEDALRRYLNHEGGRRRPMSLTELADLARRRREAAGIPELPEEEAMKIALEEQRAYRHGE